VEITSIKTDQQPASLSETERWSSLITGSAMVLLEPRERSLRGALMVLAGGSLAYHSAAGQKSLQAKVMEVTGLNQSIRVKKSVTIANKSPAELYRFWHDFENFPTFMKHLKSVTVIDQKRSHWIATAPLDASVEWDAEIIDDQENQLIAWASLPRATVDNSGLIRFKPAPQGRGTEVKVAIEYNLPGGALTVAIAKLFGEEPEQQMGDDLRRFKMLMETGEIATTAGQSSGHK
jgi:uncharacterized membrane protein